jgi:peptidoglycan/LPS O-acetylase OafA/YrhL
MRALAVLIVLIFHLWPNRLPGGFIGVDVFFVISGFLIVGNLLREVETTGIQLGQFWSRRARRLLPAALTVLVGVSIGVFALVPANLWPQFFREISGSALYVQNWMLASDSIDYLAQHNAPSPVQHYWTLSIEEQFYIAVPILMVIVVLLARGRSRRLLLATFVAISAASLAYSIWFTEVSPLSAYFVTTTRVWEFGAGALLAFARPIANRVVGTALLIGGTTGVLAAALVISPTLPFPSFVAIWPVASAAAMVAGGAALLHPVARLVAFGPIQFVGRVSYAVYLWHWPLLVLTPFASLHPLTMVQKLVIVALTGVLAWASTTFIEDPVRSPPILRRVALRPLTVTAWSAAGMAIVVAIAGAGLGTAEWRRTQSNTSFQNAIAAEPDCVGAAAALAPARCAAVLAGSTVSDPAVAPSDSGIIDDCWSGLDEAELRLCTFGPVDSSVRLLAVGDSHNGMFSTAWKAIAERTGWRIDVAGHNGCYWTAAVQQKPLPAQVDDCEAWKTQLRDHLANAEPYDAILTTNARFSLQPAGDDPVQREVEGMLAEWKAQTDRGTRIIAIRDVPKLRHDLVTCVTQHLATPNADCSTLREQALEPDPLVQAATKAQIAIVDMTDIYCDETSCVPVIGDLMAYSNEDHLTGSFAMTLVPILRDRVADALGLSVPVSAEH